MVATIRLGYAGQLVTGPSPAVAINAPVTLTSSLPLSYTAAISAPVKVSAPGLGPTIRLAYAGPLLTDVPYAVTIQAPVTVAASVTGASPSGVIRFAYAGPLQAVQDTRYWSGTAWVDGVASAFIQAPVTVTAATFTPPPAAAIRAPVAVTAGIGVGLQRDITITCALETDAYVATLEDSSYTVILEDSVPRLIRTSIGDSAYVSVLVTEIKGKDITGSTFQLSLGTMNAPGSWLTPTLVETVSPSVARLKLLVGPAGVTITPNVYRPWGRIIDAPETESVMVSDRVTIA